ncbi:MAG: CHAT domain-containing protein, partial [Burkholderiales bacterium]|nr:CHAT domain-containing protein [Burkholderiales bacterium]
MIRGGAERLSVLPELPETQIESEKISEAFTGVKKTHVREEANIDNLFSIDFDDVSVLNFSTHGVIAGDLNNAPTSALILSSTEKHSGLLTLPQLRHIQGAPEMVFLSACKTGVGNINLDRSEITSIAETFLMKGVRGILSSYWSVDSDSSVVLVAEIASNLSKGHGMSLALHLAAKSMMQNDQFSHPAKWAAYVPTGMYQIEDSSYKEVDEREVLLDFSGMERAKVVSGQFGAGYVGFFNPLEKRNQLFTITNNSVVKEVEDKIFESKFNRVVTLFSKRSRWGGLAAFSGSGGHGIFQLDSSGGFEFVCVIDRPSGYLLADLSLAKNNIILLHKKYDENHSGGNFILESIGLSDCARIKTRSFDSLAGLDAPRIRIIGKNDFIFVADSDVKRAGIYDSESHKNVLGFASRCIGIDSKAEFEVIDNELNLFSRGTLNTQLSNNARLVDDFFIAIHVDGCKFDAKAYAVDRKIVFDEERSGLTDVIGAGDFIERSILKEINEKFLIVQEVWMTSGSPSSRVYVKAFQNPRLSMAGVEVKEFLTNDAFEAFSWHHNNMFVSSPTHVGDNKTEYIWTQIESSADCDSAFEPISYGGDVI